MYKQIPQPIISLLSDKMPELETHATLDRIFLSADALGENSKANEISKTLKVEGSLLRINELSEQPLRVLGKVIEPYMELPDDGSISPFDISAIQQLEDIEDFRESLIEQLREHGLSYINGGLVSHVGTLPSKDLKTIIHEKNVPAISLKFKRALKTVNDEPLNAVSNSSALLELICKTHIENENLNMPQEQDLRSLWQIVSDDLGFEPSKLQDENLKQIASGMFAIIDGLSALKAYNGSSDMESETIYKPTPGHARFAVNAAHSLALFLLGTSSSNKS